MNSYNISIVGTGYVGLCTAVGFTSRGYKVIMSTNNPKKVDLINKGASPIYEPGLEELLKKTVKRRFSNAC